MNFENNIPTFFAGFLLLCCAGLLLTVSGRPDHSPRDQAYWRWLALIFLLLALDEQASLHELWMGWINHFVPTHGPFYFAWVVPYGLGVLAIGILYLRFVLRLPEPTKWLTIASGALYLGGALGAEMLGGWYLSRNGEELDFFYATLVACEETLEMSGLILFIYTLLDYLRAGVAESPLRVIVR
jgi:hypothetical protein